MKSKDSGTVFLLDDLSTPDMKEALLKSSLIKLRFNETTCENDYYEFKMTGSKAALDFVRKP